MFLVENTEPCIRLVGPIRLLPGINRVDRNEWDTMMGKGYKQPVHDLIEQGVFCINEAIKPTVAIVKKTYDVRLLEEWLESAKGPLAKTIKEQIKMFMGPEKEQKKEDD